MAQRYVRRIAPALVVMLVATGCAPAVTGSLTATPGIELPPSPALSPAASQEAAGIPRTSPSRRERPLWATATLTDVHTGKTVRIADLQGSIVLLEGMATWCPPCVAQQSQAQAALAGQSRDGVVYVSLDIDPREAAESVARYAEDHGFTWRFVVAPQAVLRSLAATFGDLVLSPPSTPIIVIRRDGSAFLTEPGVKSAARLTELIQAES